MTAYTKLRSDCVNNDNTLGDLTKVRLTCGIDDNMSYTSFTRSLEWYYLLQLWHVKKKDPTKQLYKCVKKELLHQLIQTPIP